MPAVLECEAITHTFGRGELAETVLRDVTASFAAGEVVMLMGPSGSGKTTLLSILGCLLTQTAGQVRVCGEPVVARSAGQLARLRRERFGFVFQHAQLLPFLSVTENLEVVGRNAGLGPVELTRRVETLLERLDLASCRKKMPGQLSGGQRQRVAIARAVLHRPPVLLADEPNAALDWQHGQEAVHLLVEQAHAEGAMLLTVSHDTRLVPLFRRVLRIEGGRLSEEAHP
jgi:putative ABC transport system ATP-binding protein